MGTKRRTAYAGAAFACALAMCVGTAFAATGGAESGQAGGEPESASAAVAAVDTDAAAVDLEAADVTAAANAVYDVSSLDDLTAAIAAISAQDAYEATIVLHADIDAAQSAGADTPFAGVPGKKVILTSDDSGVHSIAIASSLRGDMTLDRVSIVPEVLPAGWEWESEASFLHACGHVFETTPAFEGSIQYVFGGGSVGEDVKGDTSLILRGGTFDRVFGGGHDSDVSGNVSVVVDMPRTYGNGWSIDALAGGGFAIETASGKVYGDVDLELRSGEIRTSFGGGVNGKEGMDDPDATCEPASVSGTVTVTYGYDGAPSGSALPSGGFSDGAYGGSFRSTVGDVRMHVLDGFTGVNSFDQQIYIAGCGMSDIVRGTVEIDVLGGDFAGGSLYCGGNGTRADAYEGSIPTYIRNESGKQNALSVVWDNPGDSALTAEQTVVCLGGTDNTRTVVEGNALVELRNASIGSIKLRDSHINDHDWFVLNGESAVHVSGKANVGVITGDAVLPANAGDLSGRAVLQSSLSVENAQVWIGRMQNLRTVDILDGSDVVLGGVDANGDLRSPVGLVYDMNIMGGSSLVSMDTTSEYHEPADFRGIVTLDASTWHACGYVDVRQGMNTCNSHLYFNRGLTVGERYPSGDAGDVQVPLFKSTHDEYVIAPASMKESAVYGSASIDNSALAILTSFQIRGDAAMTNMAFVLPVCGPDGYPAAPVALRIGGEASGDAYVYTVSADGIAPGMDASAWRPELVSPDAGENYIVAFAPQGVGDAAQQDAPVTTTFQLCNPDAAQAGLYFIRIPDEESPETCYMWQVAHSVTPFPAPAPDPGIGPFGPQPPVPGPEPEPEPSPEPEPAPEPEPGLPEPGPEGNGNGETAPQVPEVDQSVTPEDGSGNASDEEQNSTNGVGSLAQTGDRGVLALSAAAAAALLAIVTMVAAVCRRKRD